MCHFCRSNNAQNTDVLSITENTDKIPRLSAKHRKSNVNNEHPEKEFLMSQINTLKSIVAKREAELKKSNESNELKAKRIMNLEAQLKEARKLNPGAENNQLTMRKSKI